MLLYVQLLMRFFRLAAENRDAAPLLKIIMMVDDIESLGLPGMVRLSERGRRDQERERKRERERMRGQGENARNRGG
jgi:hypothetical protein